MKPPSPFLAAVVRHIRAGLALAAAALATIANLATVARLAQSLLGWLVHLHGP